MSCSVDGCHSAILNKKYKLCSKHYCRYRRLGQAVATPIPDLPGEEWRVVARAPEYMISNLGRLKSVRKEQHKLIATQTIACRGGATNRAQVTVQGKQTDIFHALEVLRAFTENPHGDVHAIHLDGDLTNCRLDNLQWSGEDYWLPKTRAALADVDHPYAPAIIRYLDGDKMALDEMLKDLYRRLPYTIKRRIDRYHLPYYLDAEDIAQEAIISGVRGIKRGMVETSNLTRWWYGVARREVYKAMHGGHDYAADFADQRLLY